MAWSTEEPQKRFLGLTARQKSDPFLGCSWIIGEEEALSILGMKLKNSGSLAAFAMQNILKDRLVMSIYLGLHLLEGVLLISVVASV